MNKIYIFIIIGLLSLFLFLKLFIKWKFPFWSIQPVFHIYDFGYYFFPIGIIQHSLPLKNKYTNFKNIETIDFSKLTTWKITKFLQFIQFHFLNNKENGNIFNPKKENILPYFQGHNHLCFFTCYNQEENIIDIKTNSIEKLDKIYSVMTARPLNVKINNGNKNANFSVYYVDYLCVDKGKRNKGIAPQMIQTHEYNQRHLNKYISISLFKREGKLTGIVPLVVYSTFGFHVSRWSKPSELSGEYTILEITGQNIHFLYDFLQDQTSFFDIMIMPEYGNINELLKSGNIFIYVILKEGTIQCCYFLRKTCTFIQRNLEVLSCFGSINNTDNLVFIQGFKNVFWKIAKKYKFGYCAIEGISHNTIIIGNILMKTKASIISPTAFFFYNFAYPTFKPEKTFIIY
jgi:hypothetical protein